MNRFPLSRAAAALLRAIVTRAERDRDRISLIDVRSIEWQSLTFTGERHVIDLNVGGPEAKAICDRLTHGLDDAEFDLPGLVIADIRAARVGELTGDGSIALSIEALTIDD